MADWREITEEEEADIERHVTRVVRRVGSARIDIEDVLRDLEITGLSRKKKREVIRKVNRILDRLDADLRVEAEDITEQTFEHGRALTLVALGVAASVGAAKRMLRDNRGANNAQKAIVSDAYETLTDDLLAATQNTRNHVKREVRRAAAATIREGREGRQGARSQIRELRRRLGTSANLAITDRGGNTWKLNDYTKMAIRTKAAEMQVEGERTEALREDVQYGIVSRHSDPCPRCAPWEGRIVKLTADAPGDYPTIEEARASGLLHPNCKHLVTPVSSFDLLPKRLREQNGV
ncbi:phage minor capsid protein [Salibacterium aidingense]|uniref:phage minor capsid protein n=1 Tax=Salibacterium aidingense TaxID=384933 RepID=UPI003BCE2D5B